MHADALAIRAAHEQGIADRQGETLGAAWLRLRDDLARRERRAGTVGYYECHYVPIKEHFGEHQVLRKLTPQMVQGLVDAERAARGL